MKSSVVGKVIRSLFGSSLRVFMSADEQAAMKTALRSLNRPIRVLEWGSGGSTLHFSRQLAPGSRWFALEHHALWADRVRERIAREHLEHVALIHVPANGVHDEGSGDGLESTFHDYVHHPETMGTTFDVVLVDGRARVPCANVGWNLLQPDGILVLHDAQRAQYHPLIRSGGACRVRVKDPRKECDGGAIEMHFYLRDITRAEALADRLRAALNAKVSVATEAA